jgi:hypothetical protein
MKLSDRQHDVLKRMARGGVLFVRFEASEEGPQQTCWIGTVELLAMTVNALIVSRLIEADRTYQTGGGRTTSYVMSVAGRAALEAA